MSTPYTLGPVIDRPTFTPATRAPLKIALEEAAGTTVFDPTTTLPPLKFTGELPNVVSDYVADVKYRLFDIGSRVQAMDRAGIALTVVSLTMPGIEGILDKATAVDFARKVNDELYQRYRTGPHSQRFRVFGCVPMQDPEAAALEAERCVRDLGCVGVLINGFSNISSTDVQYLDEPQCAPFWAKLEELDVPLYLHPRPPPPDQMRVYKGYEYLAGSPWGFGAETAAHVIRLFDRHPKLKIIIGHCGEGIPHSLYRIDHRLRHFKRDNVPCLKPLQQYWEENFWITTAGVMSDTALASTVKVCGEDRVMYSVDYPYEDYDEIGAWFDGLEMSEATRAKIGWGNAKSLLRI
ncbi:hypothetical protein AYL99_12081 [Fonsecaea erecta]|uniref:Amidohydrolase-related domain-containing protein n=1 Tax=Fonsecaea erecta TaxID=1367422 RepID=A0A178Z3F9_9EURO|nr:hypothetical protein AYL99_12081 [Fonsecaea erecta]OAP53743.1 hypothetical protein AYL99_12081 [Fonsecaea erecta]